MVICSLLSVLDGHLTMPLVKPWIMRRICCSDISFTLSTIKTARFRLGCDCQILFLQMSVLLPNTTCEFWSDAFCRNATTLACGTFNLITEPIIWDLRSAKLLWKASCFGMLMAYGLFFAVVYMFRSVNVAAVLDALCLLHCILPARICSLIR